LRWNEFGGESYGLANTGQAPAVAYNWRIGNLVMVAQADCEGDTCSFDDVVPVTHAYARALDAHAKRTS
jgi:hypothetical protein